MSNTLVFLRHGKTKVDKDTPISQWVLSAEGEDQAFDIARHPEFQDVDVIVTSSEEKSYLTVRHLVRKLENEGRPIETIRTTDISELNRDRGGHMDSAQYKEAVREALIHPEETVHKWERAAHGLKRFKDEVQRINDKYRDCKILFVGHGYTMNMYFADLQGQLDSVYERVEQSDFCDWGIVKDGKVLRDLGPDVERERPGERMV